MNTLFDDAQPGSNLLGAAMHLAIFVPSVGILLPIVVYMTAAISHRPRLARHAAQAMGWQGLYLLVTCLLGLIWWLVAIALGLGVAWEFWQYGGVTTGWPVSMVVVSITLLAVAGVGLLIAWIAGIAGAVAALHGRPYRYPVIGRLLDRMFEPAWAG